MDRQRAKRRQRRTLALWLATLGGLAACNGQPTTQEEATEVRTGGVAAAATVTVTLQVPRTVALGSLHLLTSGRLDVTDRVKGTTSAVSLADAVVGNDVPVDAMMVQGRLTVGDRSVVKAAAASSRAGSSTGVTKFTRLTAPFDTRTVSWEAVLPTTTSPPVVVNPDSSKDVTPGRYARLQVGSRSTLAMAPGTYFIDELTVEPDGTLKLGTAGPTIVYVLQRLNYKGKVTRPQAPPGFAVIYLGTEATVLERNLDAALVAPNASVRLATPPTTPPTQRGAFFAKTLLVSPDVKLEFVPPNVLVPLTTDDPSACTSELGSAGSVVSEIDRTVFCSGLGDACLARMQALANTDYRMSAARMAVKDFTPSRYIGVSRDRTRKMALARSQPGYACQVSGGDDDKDLVPNGKDQCPNTPPYTPTDDRGCTVPLPPGPDPDAVGTILGQVGGSATTRCIGKPIPTVPLNRGVAGAPSSDGTGTIWEGFALQWTHDKFEAEPCLEFYEVEIERRSATQTDTNGRPATALMHIVPEDVTHFGFGLQAMIVRAEVPQPGTGHSNPQKDAFLKFFKQRPAYFRFRVLAINLLGERSGWSAWSTWHFYNLQPFSF